MSAQIERRVAALERTLGVDAARPLPVVLPDTATDAELDTLRQSGVDAFRWCDGDLLDLFI